MNKYKFLLLFCLGLSATACQKSESESSKTTAPQTTASAAQVVNKPVDLTAKCQSVDKQLKQFNQQGITPKQLIALNTELKNCVAHVPLEQRYAWLNATEKLYSKFRGQYESQNLYTYLELIQPMYEQDIREAKSAAQAKIMQDDLTHKRQQALAKLSDQQRFIVQHLKALYLDVFCVEGLDFIIAQHPHYNIEIFASHLLKADQVYLNNTLAEYDGGNVDVDAGLSISFDEVAKRVMIWDKYQSDFPNSHFHATAKENLQYYRRLLLLGLENTPVIISYDDPSIFVDSNALHAITQVSQNNSASGIIAQKFLKIIQQNQPVWQQLHAKGVDQETRQHDEQEFFGQVEKQVSTLLDQADASSK